MAVRAYKFYSDLANCPRAMWLVLIMLWVSGNETQVASERL